MKAALGKKDIIAEDLGFLTPSVLKLVKKTGYPGMKVLQFAFDSREESDYLPHNYTKNCVVYTGTHDNDTTEGWFTALSAKDRRFCRNLSGYEGQRSGQDPYSDDPYGSCKCGRYGDHSDAGLSWIGFQGKNQYTVNAWK